MTNGSTWQESIRKEKVMLNPPKTLNEATKHRYNSWAGNPNGTKYDPFRCAYEVPSNFLFYQCSRRKGYGPNKLYCKQHAKNVDVPLTQGGEGG